MHNGKIVITNLDQLSLGYQEVEIARPGGQTWVFRLRELTEQEAVATERMVPDPKPPVKDFVKAKGSSVPTPVYNMEDPSYLDAVAEARDKRVYLKLIRSLEMEIPGETDDERIANLRAKLGFAVFSKLLGAILDMSGLREEEIDAASKN